MIKSYEVFGEHAFRKWPRGVNVRNPINRPLFESWSYVLGRYDLADLKRRKNLIVTAARDLMTDDRSYIDAITTSTGDPRKVRLRFDRAAQTAQVAR